MPPAVGMAIAGIASAGAGVYGANKQASAANRSAALQTAAANHAADLETQAAERSLAFQQQQADLTQRNYLDTRNFNRQVYADQQARLAPYRQFGQGAITQLGLPIGSR
jgi:hypothetical protein